MARRAIFLKDMFLLSRFRLLSGPHNSAHTEQESNTVPKSETVALRTPERTLSLGTKLSIPPPRATDISTNGRPPNRSTGVTRPLRYGTSYVANSVDKLYRCVSVLTELLLATLEYCLR
jgi:hypothetical protein